MSEHTVMIHRMCIVCGKPSSVEVPRDVVLAMNNGAYIQEAWPDSTPDQREVVISGTHSKCYDQISEPSPEANYSPPVDPQPEEQ